jgi:hypothetical protein
MAGHNSACAESCALCDALFATLGSQIPNLRRASSQQWCSIFQNGRKRMAYVAHFKTQARIQVWCRGVPRELEREPGVGYRRRLPTESGWGNTFLGRFDVNSRDAINAAAEVLVTHSLPRS